MNGFEKAGRKSNMQDMHCVFLNINTNADLKTALNGSPCTLRNKRLHEASDYM